MMIIINSATFDARHHQKSRRTDRMRVSREAAARHRRTIVETAGRLFRERGLDGVGLAELMKEAGFTHGGFYNHFASKEALAAEACAAGIAGSNRSHGEKLG